MATKKSPTKKIPAAKKRTASKSAAAKKRLSLRSHIGLRREEAAFMTFRITKQTVYWLVLGVIVIVFATWLMQLQSDIQSLYDQIDMNSIETSAL